ncbi:MAG: VWA domain-containing protein [Candidatus Niyogibacteria bacterium]|nr:VWA domain-containing protein [Candidatus Niyogibacteria bacterium]
MENIFFRHAEILEFLRVVLTVALLAGLWIAWREARAHRDFRFFRRSHWKYVVGLPLMTAALMLALADPVEITTDILDENLDGRLLFLVDNSPSMQAGRVSAQDNEPQDLPRKAWNELRERSVRNPTRLALCLETAAETFGAMRGLEVAVMPYSASTQIRMDWTRLGQEGVSRARLESVFRSIQPQILGSGTDLERILADAREFFEAEPDIVFLCSDSGGGSDKTSFAEAIFDLSRKQKNPIPIYVLGVGGALPGRKAPIPQYDPEGSLRGFARYEGRLDEPEFSEGILRFVAETSGGAYQEVREIGDGRALLRKAVLTSIQTGAVRIPNAESRAWPFVTAAGILLLWIFDGFQWLRVMFRRRTPKG